MMQGITAAAPGTDDPEAIKFFETRIRPVLANHCYECHGEKKQKADLRLDNLGYMLQGIEGVPVIVPGDAVASHLYGIITHADEDVRMPPDDPLTASQIADFKQWIEIGAPWPKDEVIRPLASGEFSEEDRAWWSFQPLKKVTPPAIDADSDVDRFILAKLRDNGLEPAPQAEPRELLRRLYYNLHGLPPTEEQIAAYLNDPRPDRYERLVEELLASPRYGMRWGQHWLDLVRYAESDGYRQDAYRPDAWPYRDYVIRSFNEDKPYNQFVREQLAGDEIAPDDPETLIGTAFLRHGIYEWNQADAEMQRDLIVSELAGVTGELFLGLSVSCAQCHDHKFDPILQRDYFRMKSFFEPLQWRDDLPLATPDEKRAHAEAMAAWEAESADARAAWEAERIPAEARGTANALKFFPPEVQAMKAKPAGELTPYEKQVIYLVDRRIEVEVGRAVDPLKSKSDAWAAYESFGKSKPGALPPAFVATDVGPESPPTVMETRRGESDVAPGFLTILAPDDLEIEPLGNSTGRRTALADWITDPENPLSTRVIVNRVWQYHFGRGLSGNTSDFGRLGEAPSHPELLDWLTAGFISNQWSFKWLHRQILLTTTYRQSSMVETSARAAEVDPENRLLWRARPQRLDAEQLRDSLLLISGELKPKTAGPSDESTQSVPSIFTRKLRNSPDEVLSRFDAPPGFQSVAQRDATNTALQSLLMVNGEWPIQRARSMAARLLKDRPEATGSELAGDAFPLVLGRPAETDERDSAADFLNTQRKQIEISREKEDPPETASPLVDGGEWFPGIAPDGAPAIAFRPGTEHEKILASQAAPQNIEFTVEAIIWLDSTYPDSSVRTIASRWNGDQAAPGWALGVTGKKSRFEPGSLIMQLNGEDFQAALTLEVVASGLKIPEKKPYYVAAILSSETLPGKEFGGHIRFFAKDLSDPASKLEEAGIPHPLGGGFINPERALVIGGRDGQNGHVWSGGIHQLTIANGHVTPENLLPLRSQSAPETLVTLDGSTLASSGSGSFTWIKSPQLAAKAGNSPKHEALADLFHILINSNEFLYKP